MKHVTFLVFFFCFSVGMDGAQRDLKLWYSAPSKVWTDALPLGNGRIAAMVYGNPISEEYQLNEETISKGMPYNNYNSDAYGFLQQIRSLVFSNHSDSAQIIADKHFMAPHDLGNGGAYQPAGSLRINYLDHNGYTELRRELNISKAVSAVSYKANGVRFKEEAFTSFKDQLLVIRITASKRACISFNALLGYPGIGTRVRVDGNTLSLEGTSYDAANKVPGRVRFIVSAKIVNQGGSISLSDNSLQIRHADTATIYVSMATNFVSYHDISANEKTKSDSYLRNSNRSYAAMLADHITYYQEQFNRVNLFLGPDNYVGKPTDERIRDFNKLDDNYLAALYFQFGRYLLICCSQPGSQPANLQGIWNKDINPAWRCRYTLNINTEMNYWPSEITNLGELSEPLFKMVSDLAVSGRATARMMYDCRGWVSHHNTDLWRMTGAVDHAYSGLWPSSGAWLCQHLWNHFLYSGNMMFLRSVYPVMRGAAQFYADYLITDPRNGHQVICPSVSPENYPKRTPKASIYAGITMDNELLFDLFSHTADASAVLGIDKSFADSLLFLRSQLIPLRIGRYGQLQEWADDWDDPNDHHRHVSHLWALYPGTSISPYRNKAAFEAVKTSLMQRGDQSTGWSMGWKVCLWARCLDGNHAYKLVHDQLTLVPDTITDMAGGGGTYANMFDAHPPFQIDGNFGCTAGIAEMLIQSHDGFVFLMPSLPDAWQAGEVKGLCAVGGFIIENMKWDRGKLRSATIHSVIGGNLRLRTRVSVISDTHQVNVAYGSNPNPYFTIHTMDVERISPTGYVKPAMALQIGIAPTFLYDIATRPGDNVVIRCENSQ